MKKKLSFIGSLAGSLSIFLILGVMSCKMRNFGSNDGQLFDSNADQSGRLSAFKKSVSDLADQTAKFWLKYGIDRKNGGFYGALDKNAQPDQEAPKQLSQQARHLWFLSAYGRLKNDDEAKKEAKNLFKFIFEKFRIKTGEYALYVKPGGEQQNSKDRKLWMYMHSFVIFSFAEYFKLTEDKVALDEALEVLKAFPYDPKNGGYDQSREERWYEGVKETNSHMHAMEALMNLNEALPDSRNEDKKMVLSRFKELYSLFMTKITKKGFAYHESFDAQWNPAGEGWVNFGHDFEIVHLLLKARKNLGISDSNSLDHIKNLGRQAIKNGYDQDHGGSFYKGHMDGSLRDKTKIWWAQCEQLLALYRLHEIDPSLVSIDQIDRTFRWIKEQHLSQDIPGAWFSTPKNQGTEEWGTNLSSEWFASYHTMRALLEIGG